MTHSIHVLMKTYTNAIYSFSVIEISTTYMYNMYPFGYKVIQISLFVNSTVLFKKAMIILRYYIFVKTVNS